MTAQRWVEQRAEMVISQARSIAPISGEPTTATPFTNYR